MRVRTSEAGQWEPPGFLAPNALPTRGWESLQQGGGGLLQFHAESQKASARLRVRSVIVSCTGEHVVAVLVISINNHTNELNSSPMFQGVCVSQ